MIFDKMVYKFRYNGEVMTDVSAIASDTAEFERHKTAATEFYMVQRFTEMDWRNDELGRTDYMLMPDATYSGKDLIDTDELAEIKLYRKALRDYAYMTKDARPIRPDWFK